MDITEDKKRETTWLVQLPRTSRWEGSTGGGDSSHGRCDAARNGVVETSVWLAQSLSPSPPPPLSQGTSVAEEAQSKSRLARIQGRGPPNLFLGLHACMHAASYLHPYLELASNFPVTHHNTAPRPPRRVLCITNACLLSSSPIPLRTRPPPRAAATHDRQNIPAKLRRAMFWKGITEGHPFSASKLISRRGSFGMGHPSPSSRSALLVMYPYLSRSSPSVPIACSISFPSS